MFALGWQCFRSAVEGPLDVPMSSAQTVSLSGAAIWDRPLASPRRLTAAPRLASWMASSHPDQVALASYLDALEDDLGVGAQRPAPPLAIELHVGLPAELSLLEHRDLDNFLYPVAHRLGHDAIVAAFARKDHARRSTISMESAVPGCLSGEDWSHVQVRTEASTSTLAWKEEVFEQVAALVTVGDFTSPLELQIRFSVGPTRNWVNLWKPAIDSLGAVLGMPQPSRRFAPADGRIVALGLHRSSDATLGTAVLLDVWWRTRVLYRLVNEHGDGIGDAVEMDDAIAEGLQICANAGTPGSVVDIVHLGVPVCSIRVAPSGLTIVHVDG